MTTTAHADFGNFYDGTREDLTPATRAEVGQALAESASGNTVDLGDFTQYARILDEFEDPKIEEVPDDDPRAGVLSRALDARAARDKAAADPQLRPDGANPRALDVLHAIKAAHDAGAIARTVTTTAVDDDTNLLRVDLTTPTGRPTIEQVMAVYAAFDVSPDDVHPTGVHAAGVESHRATSPDGLILVILVLG